MPGHILVIVWNVERHWWTCAPNGFCCGRLCQSSASCCCPVSRSDARPKSESEGAAAEGRRPMAVRRDREVRRDRKELPELAARRQWRERRALTAARPARPAVQPVWRARMVRPAPADVPERPAVQPEQAVPRQVQAVPRPVPAGAAEQAAAEPEQAAARRNSGGAAAAAAARRRAAGGGGNRHPPQHHRLDRRGLDGDDLPGAQHRRQQHDQHLRLGPGDRSVLHQQGHYQQSGDRRPQCGLLHVVRRHGQRRHLPVRRHAGRRRSFK